MPLPAPPYRDQFVATVVANELLCREHYRLVLQLVEFPATQPGQFVQVACRDVAMVEEDQSIEWIEGTWPILMDVELIAPLPVLRRPFSLAGRRDTKDWVELAIIHRVVGIGTDWMSKLQVGQEVAILGPLGNRFTPPAPGGTALLVGGGVGIPPMLYLAQEWGRWHHCITFCGALSRDLLPLKMVEVKEEASVPALRAAEFTAYNVPAILTTDDGSAGIKGFVTNALEQYLSTFGDHSGIVIYTCGPEAMMQRVGQIAVAKGVECQVAVERAMACGIGTCQSCCIRLKRDQARDGCAFEGKDWIYKLACTDGPVFKGADLLW